jgi:hypothetical protein
MREERLMPKWGHIPEIKRTEKERSGQAVPGASVYENAIHIADDADEAPKNDINSSLY